jgi:hypothetical protein
MAKNNYMTEGTKVHPDLVEVHAAAVATHKALHATMAAHRKAAAKLEVEIRKVVNIPDGHLMIIGGWECPTSPVGFCIYDVDADNCMDDCLYCHKPSERP